ncbi:GNAT family N-acetyltransferase [Tuberibacillus sp. Marseille-P3662]|uniref:GNAT family N-acetyltransferase n=1 Tax=Tuberibacillus sp. Marseille-P3662 TaxID=1965358 RepID=UPI000A1CA89C|nr:GNAT family N-acetyltransferase [Tuberibacillus sp. Marseille-P3662]
MNRPVIIVESKKQYDDALNVRNEVFVHEQNVPADLEIDEFEDDSTHFVTYEQDKPIGAGRLRHIDQVGKVERICVLKAYRGHKVGQAIMCAIESSAKKQGFHTLKLNAQNHAIKFYQQLGYDVCSDEFMDAGIPHVQMTKSL